MNRVGPDAEYLLQHRDVVQAAEAEQKQWLPIWRQLNEAFYPFIYSSLLGTTSLAGARLLNTKMLDGQPAIALLVLAAGFMNGVTSPARKWVNVKRPGAEAYEEPDAGTSIVHTQIRDKILEVLAGSNYYDSRSTQVYDAAGLGTGVLLCYEDFNSVVKFVVCPPGSYSLICDEANNVTGFSRTMKMKATDLLREFGEDVLPEDIITRAKKRGAQGRTEYSVTHLIEENHKDGFMSQRVPFREMYWFTSKAANAPKAYLAKRPLYEWPVATLRWSCPDNVPYGVSPTWSVLGKAIQLQNLEYKADQGLDKMISPPLLAHIQLKGRDKAFAANGITFTSDVGLNAGARPLYQLNVPFQELEIKKQSVVEAIKNGLFNYLFDMFTQLDTVRSATEIDARREEKLVQLGPVLHRSYLEDIGVIIKRVYGILRRKQLVPELPQGDSAAIEFSNILSDVQKASDVATIERFTAFAGQVIPVFPDIQTKVNAIDLIKQYAEGLGIRPTALFTDEQAESAGERAAQMQELAQVSEVAKNFGGAAQSLGNVDVGGGLNAVQQILQ